MRRPHLPRLADIARALRSELDLRITLYADAIAQSLADDLALVAWDREQLIGGLQQRLRTESQHRVAIEPGARVVERCHQPLESIDLAWDLLCSGTRVHVQHEPNACQAALDLLRGIAWLLNDRLGQVGLSIEDEPWITPPADPSASASAFRLAYGIDDPTLWRVAGPAIPKPRLAIVEPQADRELAAYVLARLCLRRTGMDPRAIKRAFVIGPIDHLRRHLVRLWLGVVMGPAAFAGAFAGPVTSAVRDEYLSALDAWSAHPEVETWCAGGELERIDAGHFLAPAVFCTPWPGPDLPMTGPLLVVVHCEPEQARAGAEFAAAEAAQVVTIGTQRNPYPGSATTIRGALLVERLPPGLPEPRPV